MFETIQHNFVRVIEKNVLAYNKLSKECALEFLCLFRFLALLLAKPLIASKDSKSVPMLSGCYEIQGAFQEKLKNWVKISFDEEISKEKIWWVYFDRPPIFNSGIKANFRLFIKDAIPLGTSVRFSENRNILASNKSVRFLHEYQKQPSLKKIKGKNIESCLFE